MNQPDVFQPPIFRQHSDPSSDAMHALGGEPLANSGFEAEEPEPNFDERS
jgi:hypothetical protein